MSNFKPGLAPARSKGHTPATGGVANYLGNNAKPGFWYPTRTTIDETTGSTQVPASSVTEARFDEGIDPVYGIATSSTLDPAGLALKTLSGFEAPGTGSLLRATSRTLPAFASAPTTANSTTYGYYPLGATAANPCVAGSAAVDQGGMVQFQQDPAPAAGAAIKTETVYDILGRAVATRYVGDSAWSCTGFDARGRATVVTVPADSTTPAGRTITTTFMAGGDPYATTVGDAAGTLTSVVDALGRTVKSIDVSGVVTTSSYDQAGRMTTAVTTVPVSGYTSTAAYVYDTVGRLTQQSVGGLVVATQTYSPDSDTVDPGKLVGVSYPAGVGNAGNGTKGTIAYDTQGALSSVEWRNIASNALITSDSVLRSLNGLVLSDTVDGAGTPAWS